MKMVTAQGTLANGGQVHEAGWVQKPGWTWKAPFGNGRAAADDEPAVHITFHEAQAFCQWAGGRHRQRRAPHARRVVVVWRGADACRSSAGQAGRHGGGLHRLSLPAAIPLTQVE
jgi:hypothetical protein